MKKNIKDKLQKIDKDYLSLLIDIGKTAKEEKLKAYLVGGMIRDLLLGYENLDIDIVVENSAKHLAETLVKKFPNCELSAKHDRFHTAKLIFNINGKKVPVDLASTREEIYEYPAALPTVSVSDLKKDLIRRDFTINALAISLLPDDFGEVVDLFKGLEDLNDKKIKILHNKSFIDDPTRMIRAIRFAAKLGFEIEENTEKLLKEAIDSKQFDDLIEKIRGDRVKIEIRYLFNLSDIEKAIKIFFESGVYRMISTQLKPCRGVARNASTANNSFKWLTYLALIINNVNDDDKEKILKNLQLTASEIKIIQLAFQAYENLQKLNNIDSINIYRNLKGLEDESLAIVKLLTSVETLHCSVSTALIDEFINKTSKIKLEISGQDLISIGVAEGKQIGEILDKILEMKIKNPNMKKEEEIKEAEKLI
ncbi:MAG: hypothetical protein A3B68_02355 [Candidatus Melainabacteria bacterium RIFCSPHIGHO2_02_FULL_34_12]|nr:MAG: hypothetical protein A3B68_02355 [Candidatus Melainabacteria bacterium RIFCSPHIGHO2_02_FULL_34_12]